MNTKSRKTKSAEAQIPQAPEESDFVGLIKYISKREKGLSRYSDKLRTSLIAIADAIRYINISINVTDKEAYFDETTEEDDKHGYSVKNFLCIDDHNLCTINRRKTEYGDYHHQKLWYFSQLPRSELKTLVQSGRLPKFLVLVAQKLEEAETEYGVVAEIAEKMAKAIETK